MSGRGRVAGRGRGAEPDQPAAGCAFHPRCPFANERCRSEAPLPIPSGASRVRCHAVEEGRLGEAAIRRELAAPP